MNRVYYFQTSRGKTSNNEKRISIQKKNSKEENKEANIGISRKYKIRFYKLIQTSLSKINAFSS